MKAVPQARWQSLVVLACAAVLGGCAVQAPSPPPEPSAAPTPVPSSTPAESQDTPSASPSDSSSSSPSSSPSAPRELTAPSPPGISGTPTYGGTLKVKQGAWAPLPVALAYQWLRDGEAIAGETANAHKVGGADIDHQLSVVVTGSKDGYASITQQSSPVGPVKAAALKPATPVVSGTTKVGRVLTAKVSAWGPGTVKLTWQWYRDDTAVDGATETTYTLARADLGHRMKVRVTGVRTYHVTTKKYSAATAKVTKGALGPTPTPTLTGTPRVGDQLTVHPGTWGPKGVQLAYQWLRGTRQVEIPGATAEAYVATPEDAGQQLRVRVTGSLAGYKTASEYSALTGAVANGELSAPVPTIAGLATVGQVLTATPGTWGPGEVTLVLAWYRDGAVIPRENLPTYQLQAADARHKITVRVTGSAHGYTTRTVESEPTRTVAAR